MTTVLDYIGGAPASEHASGDADHTVGDFARDGSLNYCQVWHHLDGGLRSIWARVWEPVFDASSATPNEPAGYRAHGDPFLVAEDSYSEYNSGNNEVKRPFVAGMRDGSFVISYVRPKTDGTVHDANSCQIEVKRLTRDTGPEDTWDLSHASNTPGFVVDSTVTFGVSEGIQVVVTEPSDRFTIAFIHEASFNDSGATNLRTFDLRMGTFSWAEGAANPSSVEAVKAVVSGFKVDDTDTLSWATDSAAVGLFDMKLASNGDYHLVFERFDSSAATGDVARIEYRRLASLLHATPYTVLESDSTSFHNEETAGTSARDRPQRRPRMGVLDPYEWKQLPAGEDWVVLVQGDQFPANPEDSGYTLRKVKTRDSSALVPGTAITEVANSQLDADNEQRSRMTCFLTPAGRATGLVVCKNEGGSMGASIRLVDEDNDTYWMVGEFIHTTRPQVSLAKSVGTAYVLALAHEGFNSNGDDNSVGISFFRG